MTRQFLWNEKWQVIFFNLHSGRSEFHQSDHRTCADIFYKICHKKLLNFEITASPWLSGRGIYFHQKLKLFHDVLWNFQNFSEILNFKMHKLGQIFRNFGWKLRFFRVFEHFFTGFLCFWAQYSCFSRKIFWQH